MLTYFPNSKKYSEDTSIVLEENKAGQKSVYKNEKCSQEKNI